MKKLFKSIHNYLQELSTMRFIITMVLLTYLVIIPFLPLFSLYEKYIGEMGEPINIVTATLLGKIIAGSILASILETLISQYAIIEILSSIKIFKEENIVIVMVSAVLLGISHPYSYLYIFYAFIIGLLFAYSYLIYKKRNFLLLR